jgi:rare lipoprotein A
MNIVKNMFIGTLAIALLIISTFSFSTNTEKISSAVYSGIASYYHPKFNGRKTANGEIFNNEKFTAANNFLKLGTMVKVINPKNGKTVIVKINDRMNKKNHRLIDLTEAAARQLDIIQQGIGKVEIEIIKEG